MEQGRSRAGRFWKDEGRQEAIQGPPLIIITANWQSRSARTDSARQPNQKAHLLLVSLNNEPVIWINGPCWLWLRSSHGARREGWRWRGKNGDMGVQSWCPNFNVFVVRLVDFQWQKPTDPGAALLFLHSQHRHHVCHQLMLLFWKQVRLHGGILWMWVELQMFSDVY